jgi:hypothetical protein
MTILLANSEPSTHGPSRQFAAAQQAVAFGGKAKIERGFFRAIAACLFSETNFVGHPTPPHQPVLLSAMPRRTAHSPIKYDERYCRQKRPSPNPQRLKAFHREFSLSIIGAMQNLRRMGDIT